MVRPNLQGAAQEVGFFMADFANYIYRYHGIEIDKSDPPKLLQNNDGFIFELGRIGALINQLDFGTSAVGPGDALIDLAIQLSSPEQRQRLWGDKSHYVMSEKDQRIFEYALNIHHSAQSLGTPYPEL